MNCSTCGTACDLANAVSWQRLWGRLVQWTQCFGCYDAEAKRVAAERNERPAKRGRK